MLGFHQVGVGHQGGWEWTDPEMKQTLFEGGDRESEAENSKLC